MRQEILSFLNSPLGDEEKQSNAKIFDILSNIKEADFSTFRPNPAGKRKYQSNRNRNRDFKQGQVHHKRNMDMNFTRNVNTPQNRAFSRNTQKPTVNNWREKNRYLSMYSKVAKDDNEKHLHAITDKLNKITNDNYDEFVADIHKNLEKVDEPTRKQFVSEIFNRAAMQPVFCRLYVRVLGHCRDISNTIQKYISEIIRDYTELFNTRITKISPDNYDEFCQNNKEKDYRIGYSSFIGELLDYSLVTPDVVCRFSLIIFESVKKETELDACCKENVQDNIGCFKNLIMRLMNANGESIAELKEQIKMNIEEYLSIGRPVLRRKIGMKSIFALEDLKKL